MPVSSVHKPWVCVHHETYNKLPHAASVCVLEGEKMTIGTFVQLDSKQNGRVVAIFWGKDGEILVQIDTGHVGEVAVIDG